MSVYNVRKLIKTLKIQINHNTLKLNDPNCFSHFIFDFWNLFDIYNLLFGALVIKIFDFMDEHYIESVYNVP